MIKISHMRFPLWATVFTLIGIVILCLLGGWQLQRMAWKNEILHHLDEAYAANPMDKKLTYAALLDAGKENAMFLRGHAAGQFLYQNEIAVGPRSYRGMPGYQIITPMALEDGGILLINRGWVPEDRKDPAARREGQLPGRQVVTGLARIPPEPGAFTPDNIPDKGEWYRANIDDVAVHFGLRQVAPYLLTAERPDHPTYGYPLPEEGPWRPTNNHLGYALFWFAMAGVLAVIYGLRFYRAGAQ